MLGATFIVPGLSPRVRGNPGWVRVFERQDRSIPACAGEPKVAIAIHLYPRVYPRVCGGTLPEWRET